MTRERLHRQRLVVAALSDSLIHSQSDVVRILKSHGIKVTQATASRDLEELGAVRGKDSVGRIIYQLPSTPPATLGERALEIKFNGQILVVKTAPGAAQLVASRIDSAKISEIMGTIAGDDTIFIALEKASSAKRVSEAIHELGDASMSTRKRKPSSRKVKR